MVFLFSGLKMKPIKKIMIIAAEPSGDLMGAELIDSIRNFDKDINIKGVGGDNMAAKGIESIISISGFAILGLVEALSVYKKVQERTKIIGEFARDFKPDVAILIDSWGFNLRAGKAIKQNYPDVRLIKMIGPQVWATRAGRAKTLASIYDELWCIHDFELKYYEGLPIKAYAIGNPALSRKIIGDPSAFRAKYKLENKKLIGLLPGSRKTEIKRLSPVLKEYVSINQDLNFIIVTAKQVQEILKEEFSGFNNVLLIDESEKYNAFCAFDVAFACSGTVSTELGICGVPVVIGYKLDKLTYFIARNFLFKTKFITLMNVAMDKEIARELIQDDLNAQSLENEINKLLLNEDIRQEQINLQNQALDKMGLNDEPAIIKATKILLKKSPE